MILTQICSIFNKCNLIPRKNGAYKEILRCSGLDSMYNNNTLYFEPYVYNVGNTRVFENDNPQYNPYIGLDNVFSSLYYKNDNKSIIELLTKLIQGACYSVSDEVDINADDNLTALRRLYNLCGLDITTIVDDNYPGVYDITFMVSVFNNNNMDAFGDNLAIEKWLKNTYSEVYDSYKSAFDSYVVGNYGAAIESARSTLTGIFSKFKGVPEAKWLMGLSTVAGELNGQTAEEKQNNMAAIKKDVDKFNKKDIADFFGENLNGGFKKTKALYAIYSMMSDYGTHRNEGSVEIPTSEDALLMIRMMTDIVVWIYQKQNK